MLFPSSSEVCIAFTSTKAHPRAQVDIVKHGIVDSSLKQFKACAQLLSPLIILFTEESRLLERIYYKNKNQQRSALFWKKVDEIRRFVLRVQELNPEKLIESLRYSFYGSQTSSKTLRTPWTQVPDPLPLYSMLRLLVGIGQLLKQINRRFGFILSALIRQLKTLSFAPLVLTIISMLSRFSYFISEFQEAFRILWMGLINLIEGLYSQQTQHKAAKWLKSKPFDADVRKNEQILSEKRDVSLSMAVDEDTGSRIITNISDGAVAGEMIPASLALPVIPWTQNLSSTADSFVQESNAADPKLSGPLESSTAKSVKRSNDAAMSTNNKKRKKKKRDEIDNIFGS